MYEHILYFKEIGTMLTPKEVSELRQQLKRDITELDHQIHELETFYIEDTKEAGNLIKGFENYVSTKASKIPSTTKKQKVQNYQRLFSLSSTSSKTSTTFEVSIEQPYQRVEMPAATKRNRQRMGGMTKGGGKTMMSRGEEESEDSDDSGMDGAENMDYSVDESMGKNKMMPSKKKKIAKMNGSTLRK